MVKPPPEEFLQAVLEFKLILSIYFPLFAIKMPKYNGSGTRPVQVSPILEGNTYDHSHQSIILGILQPILSVLWTVGLGIDAVYNEFVFQRGTYSLRNE
jgi:hypothetical protein